MIDMTYYETIAEGDNIFITQMIKTFLEDVPIMLNSINEKMQHNDFVALAKAIHKLKPAWSMSGLDITLLNSTEAAIKSNADRSEIDLKLKTINETATIALEEMKVKFDEMNNALEKPII